MNKLDRDLEGLSEENNGHEPKKRIWPRLVIPILLIALVGGGLFALKIGTTFTAVSQHIASFLGIHPQDLPPPDPSEKNRIDILVLGLRGEGEEHGGSLTDTLMLISIKTDEKKVAFISIPRDTYLEIPIVKRKAKINEAFELGEKVQPGGGGLFLAKLAAQEVTGVNIDYAISVDFTAFQEIIDNVLGGIDVQVQKPFRENLQWGGIDFYVPQGLVHMDGNTALFYVRSRFTTSDFDRARRQQEVLLALRHKAATLGFASHPEKVFSILSTVGRHVRIDADTNAILKLANLGRAYVDTTPKQVVLDTASGLLESSNINGAYVLLPSGASFERIHERVRNIFNTP